MKRNSDGDLFAPDHPTFKPNLTPDQVMCAGSFGGTYFRPISSAVTGETYGKEVWEEYTKGGSLMKGEQWFKGLTPKTQVCSPNYNPSVNKFGVKCGGSLGMWESSGWISAL